MQKYVVRGLQGLLEGLRAVAAVIVALTMLSLGGGSQARAQVCEPSWLPGEPGATVDGSVRVTINFDPDGAGPAGNLLIAGGSNISIPGYGTQKLIAYDGRYWQPLETGTATGAVNAMAVFNNQLIVAGEFTTVGGVAATDVAAWNGTTWTALSNGLGTGSASALAVYNSQLYVGGGYSSGAATNGIARWTGTTWVAVGGGLTGSIRQVNVMLSFNGALYVGGDFAAAGSGAATNLAAWNGTTWSAVGNPDAPVYALGSFSGIAIGSSRLFVGGAFNNIGGIASNFVASLRFDPINGNTWNSHSVTDVPLASSCRALQIRSVGLTSFQINAILRIAGILGGASHRTYRLSGTSWTNLSAPGFSNCLGTYGGQMTVGTFDALAPVYAFDNVSWRPLTRGAPGQIKAVAAGSDATYVSSSTLQGTVSLWRVYERDNATGDWTQLGGIADGVVEALLVRQNGNLVAGGQFTQLDGSASRVAEWNGNGWTPLGLGIGTGTQFSVNALAETAGGDVIAGGIFNTAGGQTAFAIARWNGIGWSPIGNGIIGTVNALLVMSNGDIVAGGSFPSASGTAATNIARWNGVNWLPFAGGLPNGVVYALTTLRDGSIVAAGSFNTGGATPLVSIARWNGAAWEPLGSGISTQLGSSGLVRSLRVLANGDLVAAGTFDLAGGVSVANVARWDGAAWHPMEEGLTRDASLLSSVVEGMALDATGRLAVGGSFTNAGGGVSAYFARWGLPDAGCCDSIDFNQNAVFPEDQDVIDFFNVLSGAECPTCSDIDFNNNGVFPEDQDVIDFFTVLSGGECS